MRINKTIRTFSTINVYGKTATPGGDPAQKERETEGERTREREETDYRV